MSKFPTCLLASCLIVISMCLAASAQSSTATLSGTVVDENNAVIPGAGITVQNRATSLERHATTNDSGSFTIPLLPPGEYTVLVEREGFTRVQLTNIVLNVGDQKAVQVQLKVGDIASTVEVRPDGTLIRTDGSVGTVVDRQFVENMPLNGRSFQSLIALTPGVVLTKANANEQGQFSVNGQRTNANYLTVDGVSANIGITAAGILTQAGSGSLPGLSASGGTNNLVSIDALQEFRIQTSNYAPEFGRTPGGQVQILTRSGTNEFRGTIFEYFRNDALDANDWFANSRGLPKPALRQNDFGFVIGGPILLPRFGEGGHQPFYDGHGRTFFFLSYEGLRLRQPQVGVTSVPSLSSRQAAPPQVRPFFNAFPIPNGRDLGNGLSEFSASYSDQTTLDATSIRVDHTLGQKLTVFGRYNYAPSETDQRGAAPFSLSTVNQVAYKTQTLTTGATLAISSRVTNELRANWSQNRGASTFLLDSFGGAVPLPDSILFPPFASSNDGLYFFLLLGGNNSSFNVGSNVDNFQRQVNLIDNLSVVGGSHQLKFGIDYRHLSPVFNPRKYFQTAIFANVNQAISGTALLGEVNASTGKVFPVFNNFSAYGQDTWRVARRLTLTYGLRWDVNPPPSEKKGNAPLVLQGLDNPATIALAPTGTPLYKTTFNNFAPRIGVAYQLSQHHGRETVLRGGFGIFYDLGTGTVANAFSGGPRYSASKALSNSPFPRDLAAATPPPFGLSFPISSVHAVNPKLKLPFTYQWNVILEQSLGSNQTLSASYVAAVGRRLLRQEVLRRPNVNFTTIFLTKNQATSDYHAIQLQFQRRLSRGLQALASYTWSHSIDIASNDSSILLPEARFDPRHDRGPSDFDVRHAFNAAITYDLPKIKHGWVGDAILGGWSVDTIFTARTATPVDVFSSRDIGIGTLFNVRPDLIHGVPLYLDDPTAPGGRKFNRAAFIIPAAARQGTLGRNVLRGFGVSQLDLALRRQFILTERLKIQFRVEAFNLLNHPNFGDPVNNLTNPLFGQSTLMLGRGLGSGGVQGGFNPLYQMGGPRSIQFALKLGF